MLDDCDDEISKRHAMNVVLIHPTGNVSGNVLWPTPPSAEEQQLIQTGIEGLRSIGYWASPFPEGDGITFSKDGYRPEAGVKDFRSCLPFMTVHVPSGETPYAVLARLGKGRTISATCLVPVTCLLLHETIALGQTKFHPPVDGYGRTVSSHPWGVELCDVVGADVDPSWFPVELDDFSNLATLLGHPLIERRVEIPVTMLYEAKASVAGGERLVRFIAQDADRWLDLLRWTYCSYKRLEYLPNRAGWVGDFCYAYVKPDFGPPADVYGAKAQVLRVENNWFGLEVSGFVPDEEITALACMLDGSNASAMAREVKSALRAIGQAYYLVEPEASFLSLVYAIDALCEVGDLRGAHQRIWVCAAASIGKPSRFTEFLTKYERLYAIRNRLVHDGETLSSLGADPQAVNQDIELILASVILTIVRAGCDSRQEFVDTVVSDLVSPEYIQAINGWNPLDIKCPLVNLADDKIFGRLVDRRSTYRKRD